MRIILNTFVLVLILLFGAITCFELIFANLKITNAENFFDSACSKIEEDYFDDSVIDNCIKKAADNNYTMTVEDRSKILYGEKIPGYYVSMEYPIKIGLFGIDKRVSISGYVN